jgi:hypothetical protein
MYIVESEDENTLIHIQLPYKKAIQYVKYYV